MITYTGTNARTHVITHYENGFISRENKNYAYDGEFWIGNEVDLGIQFISHPEGYIEPNVTSSAQPAGVQGVEMDYVYQYKDHLGNIRLSYKDSNNDGSVDSSEIIEENNYYPFGLEHNGYNNVVNGQEYTYKQFQGQEVTNDFDLNIHEWKYRVSDPAIGRFWQVDPLAEDYVYNGVYNFSENRVIDAVELEGLEKVLLVDIDERPKDNGTSGTSYSGEIYFLNEETGEVNGPYEASSYPNSKSNSDNSTNSNTINEGEHNYNNESGHSNSSEKGLNIVDHNGKRVANGTDPDGNDVEMTVVNVHEGESDKGNFNSRGSEGCITLNPDDATEFFSNFNWNTPNTSTGDSSGTINIVRSNATTRKNAVKALKREGSRIKTKNFHAQKAKKRKQELKGHF